MPPLKYWKPTRTPLGERTTSRPRGGWVVRATAETALPCGAVCEVEDGGGGAPKAPSRSAEREDGRQGHAELELRASRARVGELERNEEVPVQEVKVGDLIAAGPGDMIVARTPCHVFDP